MLMGAKITYKIDRPGKVIVTIILSQEPTVMRIKKHKEIRTSLVPFLKRGAKCLRAAADKMLSKPTSVKQPAATTR
jgi:hypothetical protein